MPDLDLCSCLLTERCSVHERLDALEKEVSTQKEIVEGLISKYPHHAGCARVADGLTTDTYSWLCDHQCVVKTLQEYYD
jgi:hypothetical protein